MTVQLARTPTSGPLADVYVLHGRPLRPGAARSGAWRCRRMGRAWHRAA